MKIALFDIDGVLANDTKRVHFALDRKWADYFNPKRMSADTVWEEGRTALLMLQASGYTIGYLTGRREDRRAVTEDWLDANGFPLGRVMMRKYSDSSPLANMKVRVMKKLVAASYTDVVLFDDDDEVIRLVQEQVGVDNAVHCTWHVKKKAMIRTAIA